MRQSCAKSFVVNERGENLQKVYQIKNIKNDRVYFGVTQEFEKRKRSHINMLRKGTHNNHDLQNDWSNQNEETFIWTIINSFNNRVEAEYYEIKMINSVNNPYNIVKDISSGGDYFTHNPRKEELRQMKKEQMSGKNNHQYGKPKTQKMIHAVKEANSKPVKIEGVCYPSIAEASIQLNINATTIHYRLKAKSEKFKDWIYL